MKLSRADRLTPTILSYVLTTRKSVYLPLLLIVIIIIQVVLFPVMVFSSCARLFAKVTLMMCAGVS